MRKTLITKEQRKDAADQLMQSVIKCGPGASLKQAANSIHMEYNLAVALSKQFSIKPIPKTPTISNAIKFVPISTPIANSINKLLEESDNKEKSVEPVAIITSESETLKVSNKRQKRLSEEERKGIIADYLDGMSNDGICKKYNIVSQTIYNILKKEGVELLTMKRKKNTHKVKPNNTKTVAASIQKEEKISNNTIDKIEEIEAVSMEELEQTCNCNNSNVDNKKSEEINTFFGYFGLDIVNSKDITEAKYDDVLEVGLIADRHDMPVDRFIFNYISNGMMFDYDAQERLCEDFINRHFRFDKNGRTNKKLVLYVTGLQCALGSIIKVANKKNIDLILKHYNSDDKKYYSQTIFGEGVVNATNNPFDNLSEYGMGMYFYKCDASKFAKDTTDIYSIKLVHYKQDYNVSELEYTAAIITDSYDKIWEIYPRILMTINDGKNKDKEKLGVFIHDSKIANGKFYWGNNMSKGYNK